MAPHTFQSELPGFVRELTGSLMRREFMPVYEPVVELGSGRIEGWQTRGVWLHPNGDLLDGAEYRDEAASAGLLGFIDALVIDRAMRHYRQSRRRLGGAWLGIDVDRTSLQSTSFGEWFSDLAEHHRLPAASIAVQVDGPFGPTDVEVYEAVASLHAKGFTVIVRLDTPDREHTIGLQDCPVDLVRLDRRISGAVDGGGGNTVVGDIAEWARDGGVAVIVEGVDSDEQRRALARIGCRYGQGAHLGVPDPEFSVAPNWRHATWPPAESSGSRQTIEAVPVRLTSV